MGFFLFSVFLSKIWQHEWDNHFHCTLRDKHLWCTLGFLRYSVLPVLSRKLITLLAHRSTEFSCSVYVAISIPYFISIITFKKKKKRKKKGGFRTMHVSSASPAEHAVWLMGSMCTMLELQEVFSHTFLRVVKWDAEKSVLICLRFHTMHYFWG